MICPDCGKNEKRNGENNEYDQRSHDYYVQE